MQVVVVVVGAVVVEEGRLMQEADWQAEGQ